MHTAAASGAWPTSAEAAVRVQQQQHQRTGSAGRSCMIANTVLHFVWQGFTSLAIFFLALAPRVALPVELKPF
jgi:hypothetical protein